MPDLATLRVEGVALTVDLSSGARAVQWLVDDLSVLAVHGAHPVEHGMYPMAPWAGRLRDNSVTVDGRTVVLPPTRESWALQGTALAASFDLVELAESGTRATLVARTTQCAGWPWPTEVDVTWDLRPGELAASITVRSLDGRFPVTVGWHPWFARRLARGAGLQWSMAATLQAERGGDHLPTGRMIAFDPTAGPFDDAFVVPDGQARIAWPGALEIDVHSDGQWFVVFDELDDVICVEPQSGPPNGLNDGLGRPVAFAAPGSPHTLRTRWVIRRVLPGE